VAEKVGFTSVPVPLSVIIEGLFPASLLTTRVSEHGPGEVGAKLTSTVHVAGGGVGPVDPLGPRIAPLQPSLLTCMPQLSTNAMLVTVSSTGVGLGLLIVTVLAALVLPTTVLGKLTVSDWLIDPAMPVPLSDTNCVPPGESEGKLIVPV
jgi:hypothetical protein